MTSKAHSTSTSLVCAFIALIVLFNVCRGQEPTKTPQLVLDAQGFTDPIRRIAISNDGRWLAGAAEKVVRIWDMRGGTWRATLRGYQEPLGYHLGFIDSLTFSPDSRYLVVGVSDNFAAGSTRVYDLENPESLKTLVKGHLGCTRGVAFSSNSDLFATWGCDGNVIIYDWLADQGEAKERYRINWSNFPSKRPNAPSCFQFTEDGSFLVFSVNGREMAIEIRTGRTRELDLMGVPSYLKSYGGVSFDVKLERPFGVLVEGKSDPVLKIGDAKAMHDSPWMLAGETHRLGDASSFVASVWSSTGKKLAEHAHRFHIASVGWNSRAELAASADILGNVHVWDLKTGNSLLPPIVAMSESIWSVQWDRVGGTSLGFATENLEKGRFNYNNYGAVDRRLDLTKMTVSQHKSDGKRIPVALVGDSFELHRRGELGQKDLMITDAIGTRSVIPLGDAAEPYSSTIGKQRYDALGNIAVRLAGNFGEITHFALLDYGQVNSKSTFILGSKKGGLVEGYFDSTAFGREFRITKKFLGHSSQITGSDVSPDKKLLATSSLDGTIRIWKLEKARQLGDVEFSADGTSIDFLPSGGESERAGLKVGDVVQYLGKTTYYQRIAEIQRGNLLAGQIVDITVTRRNGVFGSQLKMPVRLSDTPDVIEPLMGFFLARDGQWVLWTAAGYYNSSTSGARYLGWHINNARNEPASFYSSDQFQQHLYQPRVVSETFTARDAKLAARSVLGAGELANVDAVAVPLADPNQVARYIPPEVNIVTPARNTRVPEKQVSIRARVKMPFDVEIRDARMFIDGRSHPKRLSESRTELNGSFREVWFEENFELDAGNHVCKLAVETSVDTNASSEVRFEVQQPRQDGSKPLSEGRLFVLAIGISDYESTELKLEFAHKDAEDFAEVWRDRGQQVFAEVETKVLTNSDATVQAIKENGLNWLLDQNLQSKDTVIVFLSGHGFFDRYDEWFFGGHELNLTRLSTTGLSDAELTSFFRKLPTNTIMFLDSCYAGQFEMPKEVHRNSRTGKSLWRGEGKIVFSSCLPQEASLESNEWQHGAFTKSILEYFTNPEADLNRNSELGCLEMILFVQERVRALTGHRQNPAAEFPSGISDVSFGRVSAMK